MKLFESFVRWPERRYEGKLEKFCLTHGRDFEATARVLSQSLFLMNLESCRSLNLWSQFFDFARKTQLCDRTLSGGNGGWRAA